MAFFLAAFAWYMVFVGGFLFVNPVMGKRLTKIWMKDKISRRWAVLTAAFGAALIWAAPASNSPGFITVLGWLTLFKAGYLVVAPRQQLKAVVHWWEHLSQGSYRLWGLFSLVVGVCIITTI